jgi:hypothetical protein
VRECHLAKLVPALFPCAGHERAAIDWLFAPTQKSSYGEGDAKEMAAINAILIIVNSTGP